MIWLLRLSRRMVEVRIQHIRMRAQMFKLKVAVLQLEADRIEQRLYETKES